MKTGFTNNKSTDKKGEYTLENPFVYESNYFHDYFRAIPFIRLKNLLDRNKINLDNKTILIASCGCGIDAHYLKKFYQPKKIYFTDIHMMAMEKTKSNFYNEIFILADNCKIAFKDNAFDYVLIAASLHHLKEPIKGLYELLRVAKEGLIVIEPNDSWLTRLFEKLGWAHEYETEHGNYVYRFSKRDVGKINKALFYKYSLTRFFSLHRVAKTQIEFLILKIINGMANCFCPSLGNYIIFLIKKDRVLPKFMKKTQEI
ncbi:MAG: class I SAM-dependent methyltransferase [Candidatus Omnitrophica bacterium]|nr:class I SAM-dependent methyltransferase [Candidatus Omnitrophota bacterium]MDD5352369.1 class I SAM-dependent methyltransferase [Candidatus Omnitrophota bacterium]MDD5549967.1 class I SAM-dependent methyltransferase [Candidatus Omnitrophota bacterium]